MYICADADAYEAEAFHKGSCTYYVIAGGGEGGFSPNDYSIT